ncbi:MAG TPA: cell division protein FtsQ/DivIB [Usitatibacteraceae bacterium]|nr:cell division protein FtsQ/DivIB [Usitatibacteraceae bacterium]
MKKSEPQTLGIGQLSRNRSVVIGAGLAAFAAAAVLAWLALQWLSSGSRNWLPVREVRFTGELARVDAEELKKIGSAIQSAGGSLLRIDLEQVRAAVKDVEWVREAVVSRRLPATLLVTIEEHEPIARWQALAADADGEAGTLLDRRGDVFVADLATDLPLLSGPEGSAREVLEGYRAFEQQAAASQLSIRVARLSARRAWQLTLSNGAQLELGRADTQLRLQRYLAALQTLPALGAAQAVVDLRYGNGLTLKTARRSS